MDVSREQGGGMAGERGLLGGRQHGGRFQRLGSRRQPPRRNVVCCAQQDSSPDGLSSCRCCGTWNSCRGCCRIQPLCCRRPKLCYFNDLSNRFAGLSNPVGREPPSVSPSKHHAQQSVADLRTYKSSRVIHIVQRWQGTGGINPTFFWLGLGVPLLAGLPRHIGHRPS